MRISDELGYKHRILIEDNEENHNYRFKKMDWIDINLRINTTVVTSSEKGLYYGRVFVVDLQNYAERWLEWQKNGLVVMPANDSNINFNHPKVIRYDGNNLGEVYEAMGRVKLI